MKWAVRAARVIVGGMGRLGVVRLEGVVSCTGKGMMPLAGL